MVCFCIFFCVLSCLCVYLCVLYFVVTPKLVRRRWGHRAETLFPRLGTVARLQLTTRPLLVLLFWCFISLVIFTCHLRFGWFYGCSFICVGTLERSSQTTVDYRAMFSCVKFCCKVLVSSFGVKVLVLKFWC